MIDINIIVLIVVAIIYALVLVISLATTQSLSKRCKELENAHRVLEQENSKLKRQSEMKIELNRYLR